uniref:DNA replication licensing factor MCM7 n=1 Tax=Echinostoma caproni TaxID=27848 RepID=A0A183B3A1_9TREM
LRGENTRSAVPGDHVLVTGVFLPSLKGAGFSGGSQGGRAAMAVNSASGGLLAETFLEAHSVQLLSKTDDLTETSEPTEDEVERLRDPEMYSLMAQSLAPEIYGHEDVKKALLLLLVGGVELAPKSGLRIRGNINICLMGDPGVAKSQLLGFVDRLSTRSQYTTGRGSSGVGLTASVMKDPLTVFWFAPCVKTTPPRTNTPYFLCSPPSEHDLRLAQHITHVHMHGAAPTTTEASSLPGAEQQNLFSLVELRRLIQIAKSQPAPAVPAHLADYLVGAYVEMRKEARVNKEMTYTSARTLLAIMRLSTARARLRAATEVTKSDIDEAMRLMEASRASINATTAGDFDRVGRPQSYKDIIYHIVRELTGAGDGTARLADVMERCAARGYTPAQVNEVVDAYENLNVWQTNVGRTRLTVVA